MTVAGETVLGWAVDPALCSRTFSNRIPATAGTFVPAIAIPITRSLQRSSNRRNIRSNNHNRSQLHKQLYLLVNSIRHRKIRNGNMARHLFLMDLYLDFIFKKPIIISNKLIIGKDGENRKQVIPAAAADPAQPRPRPIR